MKIKQRISEFIKHIKYPKVLTTSFALVIAAAVIGSLLTDTTGWYQQVKPGITPPNFVFPVVWAILFILLGLSMYFTWINADAEQKPNLILLFGLNLIFNVYWSFLFFKVKMPLPAFIDLILLWATILALMVYVWKISKKSAWMLLPYLVWVSFAGVLNCLIAFS